MLLNLHARGC
jgi:hypothetical protein